MKTLIVLVSCVSLIVSAAILAGVQFYKERQLQAQLLSPDKVFGMSSYVEFLVVESIDVDKRALVAFTKIPSVNQDVPILYHLAPNFFVQRRNVLISNGVIVGTSSTTPASINDIKQGTRGYGTVMLTENGTLQLLYLAIGEPFPRP